MLADNVFGVLPVTTAVKASVWLMVIHQWVAFALYCTPLLYMWEKLIGTHTRPWFIRLPSRLPIGEYVAITATQLPHNAEDLQLHKPKVWNQCVTCTVGKQLVLSLLLLSCRLSASPGYCGCGLVVQLLRITALSVLLN